MNIGLDDDSELIFFGNIADGKQTSPQNNQETALASPIKLIILKQNFGMHGQIGMPGTSGHTKSENGRMLKILVFRGLIRKP